MNAQPSPHQISRRAVLALLGSAGASVVMAPAAVARGRQPLSALAADARSPDLITSAEAAGRVVLDQARQSLAEGTFAVGGVLLENRTGQILHQWRNTVFQLLPHGQFAFSSDHFLLDPTNHGERQLVSWYFDHAEALGLPQPSELTIVTSLDPCPQCAGSLLAAGFHVGVVAFDRPTGINSTFDCRYPELPANLRRQLQRTFTYYSIGGVRRRCGGSAPAAFHQEVLSRATADGCAAVFQASRQRVEASRRTLGLAPADLQDPATLPDQSPVKRAFAEQSPLAFQHRLQHFRQPDARLFQILSGLVARTPQALNAAALIDPFGNLIAAFPDRFDLSPIATALMNLVQSYCRTRFRLMGDPETNGLARSHLTTLKYGTVVCLRALDPDAATTLKDLGVYDLSVEGQAYQPQTAHWQYYLDPAHGTEQQFLQLIRRLTSVDGAHPRRVQL